MAQIKIDLGAKLIDGMDVKFKAPCDCTAITGLLISYINDTGAEASKSFTFRDSHGNDLTGLGNLFGVGAYIKVILDTESGFAYIQNADTNGYLEGKKAPALETPRKIGKASFDGSADISLAAIGAAELDEYGKVKASQTCSRIKEVSTASMTLTAADVGCMLMTRNASATGQNYTITLPSYGSVPIPAGAEMEILRYYGGEVTIVAGDDCYLYAPGAVPDRKGQRIKINSRFGVCALKKVYENYWLASGDVSVV